MLMNVAARKEPEGPIGGDGAPTPAAEAALVAACQAGDAAAWRQLYDRCFPLVHRVVVRLGTPWREVPDVCQDIFVRVHRGLRGFRAEARLSTWLYRITVNEVNRAGRTGALWRAVGAVLGREARSAAPEELRPDLVLERSQASAELQQILAAMRPKQREAFVLHEIEELSLEQIAEVVESPVETVKSRLKHARSDFERLRRQRQMQAAAQAALVAPEKAPSGGAR
jgi:RNA polymerase sigma-70 factor (ECF subfamily)